jgi:hypothetical protein
MKYVKSTYRSSLSDMHLVLVTISAKLEPQLYRMLLGKYQYHSFICRPHRARILQILK